MSTGLNPYLTLPAGTVIKCPNPHCPDPTITKTKQTIKAGDKMGSALFAVDYGQGVHPGDKMQCKACNFHWFINTENLCRIHTARGWYPNDDQLFDGMKKAKSN